MRPPRKTRRQRRNGATPTTQLETLEPRLMLSTYYLADWDTTTTNFVAHGTNQHPIVSDYSADVTAQIQGAIDDVPDGNTLEFPNVAYSYNTTTHTGVGYDCENILYVNNRHDLTFQGNGATIVRIDPGDIADPGTQARYQWYIEGTSKNIWFENVTTYGANTDPHYDADRAFQHSYCIAGHSDGVTINNSHMYDAYGDGVYTAFWLADVKNVTITNNTIDGTGRQGIAPCGGKYIVIDGNYFNNNRHTIDIEPEVASGSVSYIRITNNHFGPPRTGGFDINGAGKVGMVYMANNLYDTVDSAPVGILYGQAHCGPFIYVNNVADDDTQNAGWGGPYPGIGITAINGALVAGNNVSFDPATTPTVGLTVGQYASVVAGENLFAYADSAVTSSTGTDLYQWDNSTTANPTWTSPVVVTEYPDHPNCFYATMPYTGGGSVKAIWRVDGGHDTLTNGLLSTDSCYAIVILNSAGTVVYGAGFDDATTYNGTNLSWILPATATIAVQPQSQTRVNADASHKAHFSVVVNGGVPPTYQWQKKPSGGSFADIAGATSPTYDVTAYTADDAAQYQCVITNSAGVVTSTVATLTVVASGSTPTIATQPANATASTGYTATFAVGSTSAGPLTYQWQRNISGSWTNLDGAIGSNYTIPAAVLTDNGATFRCVVTSPYGSVTSNSATLSVADYQHITEAFTGTSGPWPAQWGTNGANVTLSTNKGKVAYGSDAWCRIDSTYVPGTSLNSVQQVTAYLSTNATGQWGGLVARYNSTTNNYQALMSDDGNARLTICHNGDVTHPLAASANGLWTIAADYKIKMSVQQISPTETQIDVKLWLASAQEPANWTLSYTDATAGGPNGAFGTCGISARSMVSTARYWLFDDYDLQADVGGINSDPAAVLAAAVVPESLTTNFDGSDSWDPDGTNAAIALYRWDFGDGSAQYVSEFPTVSHTYSTAGDKTVTLTVLDNLGAVAVDQETIHVVSLPAAPSALNVYSYTQNQVVLHWTDNATNETGFSVERATESNGIVGEFGEIGTSAANTGSYTDNTAASSTKYYYRVCAYNANGDGAYAASQSQPGMTFVSVTTTVAAPTNVHLAAATAAEIDLAWTDNSSDEDHFYVERAPDVSGSAGTYAPLTTLGSGVTSYNDLTVDPSTAYWYRVRSHNAQGYSTYSTGVQMTTQAQTNPSAAPTELYVSATAATQITVAWQDNSGDETGFKIERAADVSGSPGTFAQIGAVGAGVTTYADNNGGAGLVPGTKYWYRVRSYSGGGNSSYTTNLLAATAGTLTETWTGYDTQAWPAGVWTRIGSNYSESIDTNMGKVHASAAGTARYYYGSTSVTDSTQVVEFKTSSDNCQVALIGRLTAADDDTFYRVRTDTINATNGHLYIEKVVDNTVTLRSTITLSFRMVPSTLYWLSMDLSTSGSNTTISAKAWPDGQSDPGWLGTYVDNTAVLQRAGYGGFWFTNGSTSKDFWMDNYTTNWATFTAPAVPTSPGATGVANSQITVNWTDASTTESGFKIERAPDVSGVAGTYALLADWVGANTTSYTDSGLSTNTKYWYRVYSFNQFGSSVYTTGVSATTLNLPTVTIAATDASAAETGPDTGTFAVTRAGTSGDLVVNYTVSGTAVAGDYTPTLAGTVTIPNGQSYANIVITPVNDTSVEDSETLVLTLASGTGYVIGSPSNDTVTIEDNDGMYVAEAWTGTNGAAWPSQWTKEQVSGNLGTTIQSNQGHIDAAAGTGTVLMYVNSVNATDVEQRVWFNINNNSTRAGFVARRADGDSDTYYGIETSNTAAATYIYKMVDGVRTNLGTVPIADAFANYVMRFKVQTNGSSTDLKFKLWLASGSEPLSWNTELSDSTARLQGISGRFGLYGCITITSSRVISYDDYTATGPSVVTIAATDANASEAGPDTGTFAVTRTGTSGAMVVNYTVSGTAVSGDYTPTLAGTVTIPDGQSYANIVITPTDDNVVESSETLILTLASGSGYTVGSPNNATVTIADDDVQLTESWTGTNGAAWPSQWTKQQVSGNLNTSIQSNQGRIDASGTTGTVLMYVNSVNVADIDQLVWFNINNNSTRAGFVARRADGDSDTYYATETSNTTAATYIFKMVDGVRTNLGTVPVATANTNYWMRFVVQTNGAATDLKFKMWAAGGSEPSSWNTTLSDSTARLQGVSGRFGLCSCITIAGTRLMNYDDFTATYEVSGQGFRMVQAPAENAMLAGDSLATADVFTTSSPAAVDSPAKPNKAILKPVSDSAATAAAVVASSVRHSGRALVGTSIDDTSDTDGLIDVLALAQTL